MASKNKIVSQNKRFDGSLEKLPPKKRKRLELHRVQLLRLFKKPQKTDIRWWRDVGECLINLSPPGEKLPGVETIADWIEPARDRTRKTIITDLYLYRKFAKMFSRQEVSRLHKMIGERQITANHVRYLATVEEKNNSKSWRELLKESIKHGWSSNQLQHAIQDNKHHLIRYPGRRPKARTKSNPVIAARDVGLLARTWIECHASYFGNDNALLKRIPKKFSAQLLREMDVALEGVSEVARLMVEERQSLRSIVEKLKAKAPSDR